MTILSLNQDNFFLTSVYFEWNIAAKIFWIIADAWWKDRKNKEWRKKSPQDDRHEYNDKHSRRPKKKKKYGEIIEMNVCILTISTSTHRQTTPRIYFLAISQSNHYYHEHCL